MEVDFAFLCDHADISGPKLHALGVGIDVFFGPQEPILAPKFFFVAQVRASIAEVGQQRLSIRLVDSDGGDVTAPVEETLHVHQPPPRVLTASGRLALAFSPVVFPRFGDYGLYLAIQGRELKRIPIKVVQVRQS